MDGLSIRSSWLFYAHGFCGLRSKVRIEMKVELD